MKVVRFAKRVGGTLLLGLAAVGAVSVVTTPLPARLVLACLLIGAGIGALARAAAALDGRFESGERFVLGAISYAVFSFGLDWVTRRVPTELGAHQSDLFFMMSTAAVAVYLVPSAVRWFRRQPVGRWAKPAKPGESP